jgi:hypothetical protein
MTAAWYAVVDHVGSIQDLAGQEVTIALVRRFDEPCPEFAATMEPLANGRVWCRAFPIGSQFPTRGGYMLSAEQLIERLRRDLETERAALRLVTGERDHLRGEVQRWRERAADLDAFDMVEPSCLQGRDDAMMGELTSEDWP